MHSGGEFMKACEECGEKISLFGSYQHPTLGKRHIVCSPCFDSISASVAQWAEFVKINSFKYQSKESLKLNLNKIFTPMSDTLELPISH
jgi:hypothetical protein